MDSFHHLLFIFLFSLPICTALITTNSAWISGSMDVNVPEINGNISSLSPGSRSASSSAVDASGSFWLFGGSGFGSTGLNTNGYLNDLWKYSNGQWTWISGNSSANVNGVYGTQGVPSPSNYPGGRYGAVSWIDSSGSFWLFGGHGYDSISNIRSYLNDLWKYSNGQWTWISGNNTGFVNGVYGTKGVPSPSNYPGGRYSAVSWIDSSGSFWLFGGYGEAHINEGNLNDLWKYSNGTWTWISGNNSMNAIGVYGTKGVPSPSNYPGGREGAVSWIDSSGSLWLFGGYINLGASSGYLNDLWKYSNDQWTWINGSNTVDAIGVYGTKGVPSPSNNPGSRYGAVGWVDSSGSFWLFGGIGYDSIGYLGFLNDLWRYSNGTWTWISGNSSVDAIGVYGTKGVPSPSNYPGARYGVVCWIDLSGSLWLFGGGNTIGGYNLNDLWKYSNGTWTWIGGSYLAGVVGIYAVVSSIHPYSGGRDGAVSWIDSSGSFWLFGGLGYDTIGYLDYSNELWRYSNGVWNRISGNNSTVGVYGTKEVPSSSNYPGGRYDAVSWIDSSGSVWLFGGFGYDSIGNNGYLNDLWKYSNGTWTWISGNNSINAIGVYGTKGVPSPSNYPGGREGAVSWIDSSGSLWLFGGTSYSEGSYPGYLNDLWKYSNGQWTWISGNNTINVNGTYGTRGVPSPSNYPGSRFNAVSWIDSSGSLWLFGGSGRNVLGGSGLYWNDLWKYSNGQWTWMDGNDSNINAVYGTQGVPSSSNYPGGRVGAVSWVDSSRSLWLFGGGGYGVNGDGYLNDIWRYSNGTWTWISGNSSVDAIGVYGTQGVPSPSNYPGARYGAVSWIDSSGSLWLFGGYGYNLNGGGRFNDLFEITFVDQNPSTTVSTTISTTAASTTAASTTAASTTAVSTTAASMSASVMNESNAQQIVWSLIGIILFLIH